MSRQDANAAFARTSFLYGGNAGYVEDLHAQWAKDPNSVEPSWRAFFASLEKIGFPVFRPRSPAAIAEFIDADRARWSKVIKAQNISLD